MTFGNHAPARLKDSYDFLPLMQNGVGAITRIFYDGLNPQVRVIPVLESPAMVTSTAPSP